MDKVLKEFLNRNNINLSNQTVCIGISTGVDSSVLLNALEQIKNEFNLNIVLCHVNHKKRLQSEEEERYITSYSKSHNLILEVLHLDLDEIKTENFQSAARIKRLEFFNEVMNKYNSKYLFLAHHLNDDIETSLMHIIRGSNLKGYSGISEVTNNHDGKIILRPFLRVMKDDIIEYAIKNKIKYYEDSSNSTLDYTRNRIRHKIIPNIFIENPSFDKEFIQFKETLYNSYLIVKDLRDEFIKNNIEINDKTIKFTVEKFNSINNFLQIEVLFELLKDYELSRKNILEIINLINSKKQNLQITYKDIFFNKEYNNIIISNKIINDELKVNLVINGPGIYNISDKYYIEVSKYDIKDYENNQINLTNLNVIWYNSDMLPVKVRNRVSGDRIKIKNGTKKVKDLLIDEKIPLQMRNKLLLLTKDDEVISIFGVKKSYDLLSSKNNNLLITLKERDNETT